MKIAFLGLAYEALAPEMLSAMVKRAGHEFRVFLDPALFDDGFFQNSLLARVFDERKDVIRDLVKWEPDIVAASVMTDTYPWAHEMARQIKSVYPVPIIFGGDHATAAPEFLISDPYVDYVVQGEGEYPFIEFLSRFENGAEPSDVPNVWFKRKGEVVHSGLRPLIRDLDSLPFADKSVYDHTFMKNIGYYSVMGSRGCPYKCTYCVESMYKRLYSDENESFWRPRSVDNLIEELVVAKRERPLNCVVFYDPLFGANIRWLREFTPKYREKIGVPFNISSHPGHMNEEYVGLLKEAGCFKIDLGVQTVNPNIRKNTLYRSESNEQVAIAIERLMKAGIIVHAEMIFNLPGQTDEDMNDMIRFFNKHRPSTIKLFGLRIFPGTDIEKIAADMGVIEKDFAEKNARCEQSAAKFWVGGQWPGDKMIKFMLFSNLLPFISPEAVNFILEKKLYNYFTKNTSYFLTVLIRVLTSNNREFGKMVVSKRYKYHTLKRMKEMLIGRTSA